ncbi:MAG: hypothetical protein JXB48_01390 [Candidatus Latescibacteria bacterium]|nr:hypothetical protein [Candidatus Latescibacterota bacterium]
MKKSTLIIVFILAGMYGCQQKESVRIQNTQENIILKKHKKKHIELTQGDQDKFHLKSKIESVRKTQLTTFGRLLTPPPVRTPDDNAANDALNQKNLPQVHVMNFNTHGNNISSYPFDYENDITTLKKLYRDHNLDQIIRNDMIELDKLTVLMVYTHDFLQGGRKPTPEEKWKITSPSAITITNLRRNESIGGTSEHYAALFCQLALSCGYNSRLVSMHTFDDNGEFLRNDVCEIYLNNFRKWAVFDVYNRATYYLREGIPLSALELRQYMLEDRYREIVTKSGIGDFADISSVREKLLPRYEFIYMWRMNDILSKSDRKKIFPWQALYKFHLVWEDEYTPISDGGFDRLDIFTNSANADYILDGVRYITHKKQDFNWDINNVEINVSRTGIETGKMYFDTITPNFDHFLIYVDGVPEVIQNIYVQKKIFGDYQVRSINKLGVGGPVSSISMIQ